MSGNLLGQLLGGVFSQVRGGGQQGLGMGGGGSSPLGGLVGSVLGGAGGMGGGGGLGGLLGGLMGGGRSGGLGGGGFGSSGGGLGGIGGKGAMLALLLPLAMGWVQRNGGVGAVLGRFKQQGLTDEADSWVSTGENRPVDAQAMAGVMGDEELSRLSQQLGVSPQEVSDGMAQVMPEVVHHLTPDGSVPHDADDVLANGSSMLEKMLGEHRRSSGA